MPVVIFNNVTKDQISMDFFEMARASQEMAKRLKIINTSLVSDRDREGMMIRLPADLQDKLWSNSTLWLTGKVNQQSVIFGVTVALKHNDQGQLDSIGLRGFRWEGVPMGEAPTKFVEVEWNGDWKVEAREE